MIILSLNMALYFGLFLVNKCVVFWKTWTVIKYDPKSFSNSEIQKLVTESRNLKKLFITYTDLVTKWSDEDFLRSGSTANRIREIFIGLILLLQI